MNSLTIDLSALSASGPSLSPAVDDLDNTRRDDAKLHVDEDALTLMRGCGGLPPPLAEWSG